ncbi:MAG: hypothetical protein J0H25_11365, partial [Rhizobiales bacterium]|nr:hypothetical protein [Hyphomicrobiales bacterium]
GYSGQLDVAIKDGKIAAVEAGIDKSAAAKVHDASGQYVTPGLIDLHTHIYWGATYWGIDADPVAARSGVTTWLDVGSSGSYNFPGFRRYVVEANKIRAFALLNISSIGLVGPTWELANLDYCDVPLATEMINQNRDIILGVKARIDKDTTRGTGIRPLQLARELADNVDLPLMVHIGQGPPLLPEIAEYLRPGDILTHCFTGHQNRIVDDSAVLPFIDDLHKKGLILDIGHGTGSVKSLFEGAAAGETGASAEIIANPHNQTLYAAVQWGLLGVLVLYGIWLSHLLLFRGASLAHWIGLLVVAQNVLTSTFNSHLFDFVPGWIYVLGVGVAGGMVTTSKAPPSRNAALKA